MSFVAVSDGSTENFITVTVTVYHDRRTMQDKKPLSHTENSQDNKYFCLYVKQDFTVIQKDGKNEVIDQSR